MILRGPALLAMLLLAGPAVAMDGKGNSTDHFTVGSSLATAAVSGSTSHPARTYQAARDDALLFIASDGRLRGARLEQALGAYRQQHPNSSLSDRDLAQAIACR
ncbi:DUF2388 domain-containing protein [Pseudomonas mosselii]|jgi:uncharacterized protein (TIGR02448 family)|uniref:DUF2388 domain-containing protein n=1 Tax=Pseudomonas mosselii TaxID=78327 RepID=UPI000780491E|nr:DUF2388 domain-containing protein [Pseudomonas mosselii]KXG79356.1 Holliday junction helicase [Pseudomonas mosselii]MCH7416536.1 DUF2388 domain-containing protein [Pseudomonas mosselii]MDH1509316.1 DUF2388 domain-containing protein [Pseudomonas mosselii]ODB35026.1 Holliday junction helicase [Pseudomonas mosselii]